MDITIKITCTVQRTISTPLSSTMESEGNQFEGSEIPEMPALPEMPQMPELPGTYLSINSADSGTAYKAKSCSSKIPADEVNKDNGMIKEGTRNEITTMDVIEALFKQRELLLENQSSILEEFLSNPTDQFDDYAWIEKEVQSEPLTNQDSRINIIKDLCQKIDTVIDERPLGKKRKMANDK